VLKLLIAEDEYLERKALRFLLNKYYSEQIEIVAEATNGEDAYHQALGKDIDIILMDIKMPGMDGLKAAELIKKKRFETEIIVLTAHSEFEYAQKSIHIGVSDYLVKPYLEKEFCSILNKSIKKINTRKSRILEQQELKVQLEGIVPLLEKEIILKLIYGEDNLQEKFNDYKKMLEIRSNKFMCIILNSPEKNFISEDFLKRAKMNLKGKSEGVISYCGLQEIVFLLLEDNLAEIIGSREYKDFLFELKNDLSHSYQIEIQISESSIYSSSEELFQAYEEARSQLLTHEKWPETYLYEREKIIYGKIIARDMDGVLKELSDLFCCLVNNKQDINHLKDYFREFIIFLNRSLKEYSGTELEIFSVRKVEMDINGLEDIVAFKAYFQNFLKSLVEKISEQKKDKKVQLIEIVKDYINKNYYEDISLGAVAEYISFSHYYLCKLFKEVEGINFKEYVIKVRMEKAKEMLKKGEMIKKVASSVGYSDPNYFSRAFKSYTGISPSKYI